MEGGQGGAAGGRQKLRVGVGVMVLKSKCLSAVCWGLEQSGLEVKHCDIAYEGRELMTQTLLTQYDVVT